jgi:hypothetical protein
MIHDLADDIGPTNCVCPRGGVVGMKPPTVHALSRSKIDAPRMVLDIERAAFESIRTPSIRTPWQLATA